MIEIQKCFFELLSLSLEISDKIPTIQREEWKVIYEMAKKQSMLGVVFDGIEKMGDAARMDEDLLMKWLGQCKQIERRNFQLNEAVALVSEYFKKKGLDSCILKGQGNALMYPNPMHRTPGDIDIWVSGKPSDVIRFVRSVAPDEKANYHHIDFPAYKGIPVEVHYHPCYLLDFVHNARLQKFFRSVASEQFGHVACTEYGKFAVPTASFNVVYQLVHIYNHLFQEGIGLRQIVDYYLVVDDFRKVKETFLKTHPSSLTLKGGSTASPKPLSPQGTGDVTAPPRRSEPLRSKVGGPSEVSPDYSTQHSCDCLCGVNRLVGNSLALENAVMVANGLAALQRELKHFGLYGFAGAVMYVLHEVLGLPEERMIVPMDNKRGRFLLEEILASGNFGKYDERYGFGHGTVGHNMQRLFRDLRLVRYYPAEALSEPVFRFWHFLWRKFH